VVYGGFLCCEGKTVRVKSYLDYTNIVHKGISYNASRSKFRIIDGSELVKDLMVESIEYHFGKVDRLAHRIQWLSDNMPYYYTARGTIEFAQWYGSILCKDL